MDEYWEKLTADGGKPGLCGWLEDKFGVSWQIIPRRLMELNSDPDPERAGRAMEAMLQMSKIEIAEIERAADAFSPGGAGHPEPAVVRAQRSLEGGEVVVLEDPPRRRRRCRVGDPGGSAPPTLTWLTPASSRLSASARPGRQRTLSVVDTAAATARTSSTSVRRREE